MPQPKAALFRSLGRWLLSMRGKGIRVNVLQPGPVETDMLKQTDGFRSAQFLTEMPQGCLVDAISVASMAVFLLSEKAKSITGSMVNVDGGYTL